MQLDHLANFIFQDKTCQSNIVSFSFSFPYFLESFISNNPEFENHWSMINEKVYGNITYLKKNYVSSFLKLFFSELVKRKLKITDNWFWK